MRISYWSSDVCSSDLGVGLAHDPVAAAQALVQYAKQAARFGHIAVPRPFVFVILAGEFIEETELAEHRPDSAHLEHQPLNRFVARGGIPRSQPARSEEHTSELQSLMRISYAVFCLKKKTQTRTTSKRTSTNR